MKIIQWGAVLLLALTLTGCATGPNPRDPYEGFNRSVFKFNDSVDQAALKPAATAYRAVLPSFVQTGIGNFFGNLDDVWTFANDLLQAKIENGVNDFMRVVFNTTFGLGGVLDISSDAGLKKHNEDFGKTLARWGVGSGPYVVLPFLGPTTMRDTVALPVDFKGDVWQRAYPVWVRNTGSVVRVVEQRANILDGTDLIEEAALDRYEFVRDAYLQRRQSQIDGGTSSHSSLKDEDDYAKSPLPDGGSIGAAGGTAGSGVTGGTPHAEPSGGGGVTPDAKSNDDKSSALPETSDPSKEP